MASKVFLGSSLVLLLLLLFLTDIGNAECYRNCDCTFHQGMKYKLEVARPGAKVEARKFPVHNILVPRTCQCTLPHNKGMKNKLEVARVGAEASKFSVRNILGNILVPKFGFAQFNLLPKGMPTLRSGISKRINSFLRYATC